MKNSLGSLGNWFVRREERNSKLKDISIEMVNFEGKKNKWKWTETQRPVGYHQTYNGRSKRKGKKVAEKICKKTMAEEPILDEKHWSTDPRSSMNSK